MSVMMLILRGGGLTGNAMTSSKSPTRIVASRTRLSLMLTVCGGIIIDFEIQVLYPCESESGRIVKP